MPPRSEETRQHVHHEQHGKYAWIDLECRKLFTIKSRIIWAYDSSGVQAKKYFGSMYEPILMMVKDAKNYTFNSDAIW